MTSTSKRNTVYVLLNKRGYIVQQPMTNEEGKIILVPRIFYSKLEAIQWRKENGHGVYPARVQLYVDKVFTSSFNAKERRKMSVIAASKKE